MCRPVAVTGLNQESSRTDLFRRSETSRPFGRAFPTLQSSPHQHLLPRHRRQNIPPGGGGDDLGIIACIFHPPRRLQPAFECLQPDRHAVSLFRKRRLLGQAALVFTRARKKALGGIQDGRPRPPDLRSAPILDLGKLRFLAYAIRRLRRTLRAKACSQPPPPSTPAITRKRWRRPRPEQNNHANGGLAAASVLYRRQKAYLAHAPIHPPYTADRG